MTSAERPPTYRHDFGPRVIEMDPEQYEKEKKIYMRALKRRILGLSCVYLIVGLVFLIVSLVFNAKYNSNPKLQRKLLGVRLKDLFYVSSLSTVIASFLGFHIWGHWKTYLDSGFRLVVRSKSFLLVSWLSWAADLWYCIAAIRGFHNINFNYLTSTFTQLQAISLCFAFFLVLIPPLVLRTIFRKTRSLDEMFAAEFLSEREYERRLRSNSGYASADGDALLHAATTAPPQEAHMDITIEDIPPQKGSAIAPAIPFAQPVFMLDEEASISKDTFDSQWNHLSPNGSFSCNFSNSVTLPLIQGYLASNGFTVVASSKKREVIEVQFAAYNADHSAFFTCEFIVLLARRYFQATFKCDDPELTSEFVKHFQLQNLLSVEES